MSTLRPEGAERPVGGPGHRAAGALPEAPAGTAAPAPARRFSTVHVLGSRELGGADRFFIRLVEALARAGHPTLAVTRRDGPVTPRPGRRASARVVVVAGELVIVIVVDFVGG